MMWKYELSGVPGALPDRREVPQPVPGPGQIVIRMMAVSLNYRDLLVAKGRYISKTKPGLVPISDGSGEVAAIGAAVSRFRVGDRVCPTFFETWLDGNMTPHDMKFARGGLTDGVLSEYLVCDQSAAVRAPGSLSFEEAACLPCAGVTAWASLFGPRPIMPGQTVLTLGTGGVSCFAIQIAHASGARVISTSSSDQKLARAKELGSDETINYLDRPVWHKEVQRLTDGRGVDHVIEVGGQGTLQESIRSTAIGGQIHQIGVLTEGAVNTSELYAWKSIRGIYVGSRAQFEHLNEAVDACQIRPEIDQVFDLLNLNAAYERLASGAHVGKIVVRF